MRFVIYAMGPGETCHGYAIAQFLLEMQHQVTMALLAECNLHFCKPLPDLSITITPTPEDLSILVHSSQPDAVFLCNSKSFNTTSFVEKSPWPGIPTFGVDSNWLFDPVGIHRCIQWLDIYFIVFPEPLFKLGYKEHGGHFGLPPDIMARIQPAGFIPSYHQLDDLRKGQTRQSLGIQPHEKFIFCYISGYGARIREYILRNLFQAVSRLRNQGRSIKVIAIGNFDLIEHLSSYEADWLILRKQATIDEFYAFLSSANLVFQHQGHGTLPQTVAAQVPAIVNIEIRPDIPYPLIPLAENIVFQQAGLCQLLYSHSPLDDVQHSVETLLYDDDRIAEMRRSQQQFSARGELHLYSVMMEHLTTSNQQILSR